MRVFALILAACAASTLNWSAPAAAVAPSHAAPAEDRLPHISVVTIGKGEPIVLVPGLSTPRAVWDATASELARDHQLILVQVNGFAGDDPGANLAPALLDGVVEDLHAYLARRKAAPVRLIGHSMGGLIGLKLAKAHPADLKALMIVDALPYVGEIFVPGATVAQLEPQAKAMRDRMVASFGKPADAAATRTAAGMALKPDAQQRIANWIAKADARVSGEAMYEALTTDLRPQIASLSTPITVVYPYSPALPKERADPFYRGQYAKAPHVTFVGVADAGHFVMLDQPEAFAAAVREFVK